MFNKYKSKIEKKLDQEEKSKEKGKKKGKKSAKEPEFEEVVMSDWWLWEWLMMTLSTYEKLKAIL